MVPKRYTILPPLTPTEVKGITSTKQGEKSGRSSTELRLTASAKMLSEQKAAAEALAKASAPVKKSDGKIYKPLQLNPTSKPMTMQEIIHQTATLLLKQKAEKATQDREQNK